MLIKVTINTLSLGKIIINIMVKCYYFWTLLLEIKVCYLSQSSSYCYIIFLTLSKNFPPFFIYK